MHVTKLVVEPMLSFITKVTAAKVAQQGAEAPRPLREQVGAAGGRGQAEAGRGREGGEALWLLRVQVCAAGGGREGAVRGQEGGGSCV